MNRLSSALLSIATLFFLHCSREHRAAQSAEPPPIIVISIDTLRSDHLPAYGYAGVQTPNIDALRLDSILFRSAWSHVPLTLPSHVSILTGLLPTENGVRNNLGYHLDVKAHPPITSALKERGYASGAAVSAYVLRGETGLRDAFDFYDDSMGNVSAANLADLQRPGAATEAIAEKWIGERGSQPYFFLLHLFEPHAPYEPPAKFANVANPYDGEIAAADEIVGRFIDFLKRSGVYERAAIVLLSDHGEGLNDHGEQEHGIFLYREAIQVPLMVKLPKNARAGSTVEQPVELIDVVPTIAEIAGVTFSGRGRSLLSTGAAQRSIYSETYYPRIHLGWSELRSIIDGRHHYIEAPKPELYDLRSDAAEKRNVLSDDRRTYAALKRELSAYDVKLAQPENVSSEDAAKLAALGYIGSTANATGGALPDPKDEIGNVKPMQDAARLAAQGRGREAVAAWREVLRKNPRMVAAWTALATELENEGKIEEAVAAWSDAMRNVPEIAPNIALSRGSLYLRMGRLDDATRDAGLAASLNPAAAHQLGARIAMARRDFAAAEAEARQAMSDSNYRLSASVTLAQALSAQGRRDEALSLLDQSVAEAQQRGTPVEFLQFARGDLLMMLGQQQEAQAAFREEIRAFPAHLRAYTNLAAISLLNRDRDGAAAVIDQMVAANPRLEAYVAAARFYASLGDTASASKWQAKAREAAK